MSVSIKEFIREYHKAVDEGHAAIFAGSGLSASVGFVNWKELLRDLAEDINLDIDKETDLVAVAQYYRNERGGRSNLNQIIIDQFTRAAAPNKNIEILASLPIDTYWTTNYDQLIETQLKKFGKVVDTKIIQENLATTMPERNVVVYKMHGDISDPSKAILTKDDYESYNEKRSLFTTSLQGDLISKTFLFIGFSFEDPNLAHILSHIRTLLSTNQRSHYCFFEEVNPSHFKTIEEYNYAKVKQELRIKDLQRYS
ncbi:SIR2 family protein, partial [Paenibacillus sp. P3E]|uniref:SIR2 family NAD-dependent protein deacylase n=2 Tax=unclassified Paenibacillus TaxID=185978 RepID=UPI0015BED6C4